MRSIEAEHECCFEAALPGRGMASSKRCSRDCLLWLEAFASIQEGCWNFSFATPATIPDPSQNSHVVPHVQVFGGSACNLVFLFQFRFTCMRLPYKSSIAGAVCGNLRNSGRRRRVNGLKILSQIRPKWMKHSLELYLGSVDVLQHLQQFLGPLMCTWHWYKSTWTWKCWIGTKRWSEWKKCKSVSEPWWCGNNCFLWKSPTGTRIPD